MPAVASPHERRSGNAILFAMFTAPIGDAILFAMFTKPPILLPVPP